MITLFNASLVAIASFIITFILSLLLYIYLSVPSDLFITNANLVAGCIHLALGLFMLMYKRHLEPNDDVEFTASDGKIYFGTIDKINNNNTYIITRRDGQSETVPKQNLVDSWKIKIFYDKLQKVTLNGTETIAEKFEKISNTLKPERELVEGTPSLTQSTALFSLFTSAAHFLLWLNKHYYLNGLKNNVNVARWIEYFITSGIMMVNTANVNDVCNLNDVLSVFTCTAITNLFGLAIEQTKSIPMKWFFMASGFVPFVLPWLMIINKYTYLYDYLMENFLGSFKDDEELFNGRIKIKELREQINNNLNLVGLASGILFFLYFLFPAIQCCQILYPDKYKLGELMFILSSLFSKTWLNVGVYLLARRPNTSAEYLN